MGAGKIRAAVTRPAAVAHQRDNQRTFFLYYLKVGHGGGYWPHTVDQR
jgi:hypothetical protein